MNSPTLPVLGITLGDPAGIGPEVAQAALASGKLDPRFSYRVIGEIPDGVLPGQPSQASARAALEALHLSAALLNSGEIEGIITGPVSKARLVEIGFDCPGQTEFYARAQGITDFAMLLTGEHLTVGLVTWHIPLMQVASHLSIQEIVRVGRLVEAFCRARGHAEPRIAVPGLNPHAGEDGLMGREEIDIVTPAIRQLQSEFPGFSGPYPPDTLFARAARGDFHAVLCLYHDQGLIPLKLLDFDTGVNVTLGLPRVRTSPDHGTAFDIAGRGLARPDSMITAINLAATLTAARLGLR